MPLRKEHESASEFKERFYVGNSFNSLHGRKLWILGTGPGRLIVGYHLLYSTFQCWLMCQFNIKITVIVECILLSN